jgi:hypothetical protein
MSPGRGDISNTSGRSTTRDTNYLRSYSMARDQKTDNDNSGDPVNATGGMGKSPTHGQADVFQSDMMDTDNNAHRELFPVTPVRRDD